MRNLLIIMGCAMLSGAVLTRCDLAIVGTVTATTLLLATVLLAGATRAQPVAVRVRS